MNPASTADAPASPPALAASAHFPAGLHHAYFFSACNALPFQIVLTSPMVLYAKTLGASATVLGIIAGMMPLLVIFQIPAASHVDRIGYRRFVLAGWSTRVCFIFLIALVPLLGGFLDPGSRLALILLLLFGFNLSRGISSCAWLPWISALTPEGLRGRYLARDAAVMNLASFGAFLVAALVLAGETQPWQFAGLFAFSAVAGAVSLLFLKRIPDVEPPHESRVAQGAVPYLHMIRHPPFRKLLLSVVAWSLAYGGVVPFTVAFLKSALHLTETRIMLLTSVCYLGGLSTLWLLGSRLDRLGSKPVLAAGNSAWIAVALGWMTLAAHVLPPRLLILLTLQVLMGLLAALVNMANTRLAMAVIPVMGRNHFFAIYSVVANVTLGVSPILWGLLIDAIGERRETALGWEWNRHSVFFAAVALMFGLALLRVRRLKEPKAASMEQLLREILVQSPQRFWMRLWPRS